MKIFFTIEAMNMIFYYVLSEAILYQGKPLDLSNTLINPQYLENLVCQDLVLQSIAGQHAYPTKGLLYHDTQHFPSVFQFLH